MCFSSPVLDTAPAENTGLVGSDALQEILLSSAGEVGFRQHECGFWALLALELIHTSFFTVLLMSAELQQVMLAGVHSHTQLSVSSS